MWVSAVCFGLLDLKHYILKKNIICDFVTVKDVIR